LKAGQTIEIFQIAETPALLLIPTLDEAEGVQDE
jgi:hypothetical protein